MIKKMTEIKDHKEYVSIYADMNDSSKFIFGQIIAVNEKQVAIARINPNGEDDGIIVIQTARVYRLEHNSKYEKKLKQLMKHNSIITTFSSESNIDKNILVFYLNVAFKSHRVVSLELCESGYEDIIGFIKEVQSETETCVIEQVDSYGEYDGESYFRMGDITQLSFGSNDEKQMEILYNAN